MDSPPTHSSHAETLASKASHWGCGLILEEPCWVKISQNHRHPLVEDWLFLSQSAAVSGHHRCGGESRAREAQAVKRQKRGGWLRRDVEAAFPFLFEQPLLGTTSIHHHQPGDLMQHMLHDKLVRDLAVQECGGGPQRIWPLWQQWEVHGDKTVRQR